MNCSAYILHIHRSDMCHECAQGEETVRLRCHLVRSHRTYVWKGCRSKSVQSAGLQSREIYSIFQASQNMFSDPEILLGGAQLQMIKSR